MWTLVLTDLAYTPVGELLNASGRNFSFRNRGVPTAGFTIRMDNPLANFVASGECLLKAYRNDQLQFFGPVISAEESADADGGTLAVTAAGAAWYLSKRVAGKSTTGRQFTSLTDRAEIARTLISEANVESPLPIDSSQSAYSGSTITYEVRYRLLSDALVELANTLDGFDWDVVPTEPSGDKIGVFRAQPIIGQVRNEAIFEFGVGKHNVSSYKLNLTRDTQANKVFHPGEGNQAEVSHEDTSSIAKWTRLEDIASADLTDVSMRTALVQGHVQIRKNPRRLITFKPHIATPEDMGRVPQFGTDYVVGDTVRGRAQVRDQVRFDAYFRVYGARVEIDEHNVESVTLTLEDTE